MLVKNSVALACPMNIESGFGLGPEFWTNEKFTPSDGSDDRPVALDEIP